MAAPLPGALEGYEMTPGSEAAAEGGQMKSGVSASPRGRPLAVGHEPDDRYANVGLDLAAELAAQARSLAQGVVLACDGDIVAVERLRQAL